MPLSTFEWLSIKKSFPSWYSMYQTTLLCHHEITPRDAGVRGADEHGRGTDPKITLFTKTFKV